MGLHFAENYWRITGPGQRVFSVNVEIANVLLVNTTQGENDGRGDDGDCSLRDALTLAQPDQTVVLPPGNFTLSLGNKVDYKIGAGGWGGVEHGFSSPRSAHLMRVNARLRCGVRCAFGEMAKTLGISETGLGSWWTCWQ